MSCLVLKNDGIGDLIVSAGIISRLADHFGGELDLVTCEQNAELAGMIPGVRKTLLISRDDLHFSHRLWKFGVLSPRGADRDRAVLQHLRSTRYDVAISLRRFIRQSTLAMMHTLRAKARYCAWEFPGNTSLAQARRASRGWQHFRGSQDLLWEPAYYQAFLRTALGVDLDPSPRLSLPAGGSNPEDKSVALGIGGSTATWPDAYWKQVAKELAATGWRVGIFGGPDSAELAARITADTACENWVGKLNFRDTATHLSRYAYYIGYDTGLSHFACLVARKALIIYGGGTFRRFFPWPTATNQHVIYYGLPCFDCDWSCKHPEKYCLTYVRPEDVLEYFHDVASGTAPLERDLSAGNEQYHLGWRRAAHGGLMSVRPPTTRPLAHPTGSLR